MSSESLEPGVVIQFAQNIQHVGQQKQNRLVPHVDADLAFTEKGDRFTDETFGLSEPVELVADWSDTPTGTVDQYRRIGFGKIYADAKHVTSKEDAEKLISPKNPVVQAMAFGRERRRDKVILERGIFAPSMNEIDQDGNFQTVVFPSSNIVAVDDIQYFRGKADGGTAPTQTGSGEGMRLLTPAKIRKGKKVLADGENDNMGRNAVLLYEEQDLMNMMTSEELTDADLTMLRRLESGEINSWMGVDFVKVDPGRLPRVAGQTDQFYTALYLPHYLKYKDRPLVSSEIGKRKDKNYNWEAYYKSQDFLLRSRDDAFVWIAMER